MKAKPYEKRAWGFLSALIHSWTTRIPFSSLHFKLKYSPLLSSLTKVKFSGEFCSDIESISTIFNQQLKIKLIHLLKYFVFWEISWEWWECLKLMDWISSHYYCRYWMYLVQHRSWHFLLFYKFFLKKIDTYDWMSGCESLQFTK